MIIIKGYSHSDIKKLKLLGKGTQGEVYLIDERSCIKLFYSRKTCREELKTLQMVQGDPHFPRLYEAGEDYIIREYISGIELNEYLKEKGLTAELTRKIIKLYEAMEKAGYRRLDAAIFHVFATKQVELKLIDTAKCMSKKREIPSLLISGLDMLGFKGAFFHILRAERPELYVKWRKYKSICYKKIS